LSREFHIAAYTALVVALAFMTLVNIGLTRVNDHVLGKCSAPAAYTEKEA
jgi:hypothetical protein